MVEEQPPTEVSGYNIAALVVLSLGILIGFTFYEQCIDVWIGECGDNAAADSHLWYPKEGQCCTTKYSWQSWLCITVFAIPAIMLFASGQDHKNEHKAQQEQKEQELGEARELAEKGGVENINRAIGIFDEYNMKGDLGAVKTKLAEEFEELLRHKEAIDIWEELGRHDEAKRIRKTMREEAKVKVDQTVVHGDYVDDRDTFVRDSVVSRSSIGSGGSSKMQELKELKEMLSEGLIDKDEFKQMKKEILGK